MASPTAYPSPYGDIDWATIKMQAHWRRHICNIVHIHGADVAFNWASDYPAHFVNWHDRETGFTLKEGLTHIQGAASGGST